MLGNDEIRKSLDEAARDPHRGILVVPSVEATKSLKPGSASLDFRLGRWFLAIQQTRTSEIDLTKPRGSGEFEAQEGKMYYVPFGQKFVMHPGRFVLAATLEWIRMPETLGGYITGRSTIGRRGLVIETAAGLHPGFSGCVTLELSNCGEVPVAVVPGMKICQIFFHELQGGSKGNETSLGGRRKPTFGNYSLDGMLAQMCSSDNGTLG
jgi:dCTP deaminase